MLTILYQDDYLVAVDKPAGLFVHRSFMDKHEIYFALQLVRDQIGQYVYPVHRLDRPTSGVLLFALTKEVARKLNEDFANKTASVALQGDIARAKKFALIDEQSTIDKQLIQKTYYALVRGHFLAAETDTQNNSQNNSQNETINDFAQGLIDYPLKEKLDKLGDKNVSRDKAPQLAKTHYQVVEKAVLPITLGKYDSVRYSLVKLKPITGRRHQIRRHLAHLRHPIIGDINYGDNKQNPFFIEHFGFKRLMLIAKSLAFIHPITELPITITAPFDQQWQQIFSEFNWSYS
ncbi:MAG: pseudouridine synthase [Colwellia sp.]